MIPQQECTAELAALGRALGGRPAPCMVSDPDVWHDDPATAINACGDCHALPECAALAAAIRPAFGVWGARDYEARRPSKRVAP